MWAQRELKSSEQIGTGPSWEPRSRSTDVSDSSLWEPLSQNRTFLGDTNVDYGPVASNIFLKAYPGKL
jgi:hypothetical protein